jgi:hypothetical protein
MTDTPSRTSRVTTLVVAGLIAVVVGGVAFGATRAGTQGGEPAAAAPTASQTTATSAPTPSPTPTATAPLQDPARIQSGLTAEIVSMRAVQAKATQPGEVGGPAVSFTIRLTNSSGKPIDLSSTVVNVFSGVDQAPAYQLDADGIVFPASVAAKRSVTGTAVFTIPKDDRGQVQVTVDTASAPLVAFTGAAPR